jgi:hypothetical protein
MFGSIIYVIVVDKNTTSKLKLYYETKNHLIRSEKWQNQQLSEINHLSIANELKSQHAQEVKRNRRYLQFIIENLLFLGKQGLALRGHEESSTREIYYALTLCVITRGKYFMRNYAFLREKFFFRRN